MKRVWLLAALIAVSLVLAACRDPRPPEAATPPAVIKRFGAEPLILALRLDRERLTVAEQLTVELRAETSEEYAVKFGEDEQFPGFVVASVRESPPELIEPGRITVTRRYLLDPLVPGSAEIPALAVDAWNKAEQEATPVTVTTEPVTVSIVSLLPQGDQGETLSDIAPPLAKPVSHWLWFGIALGAAVVLLASWYFWQSRRRQGLVPPPPLPPHLAAYQALDCLMKGNLLANGQVTAFYQQLSDIIRLYIEQRFGLRAPERTTEEFLSELGAVGAGPMADPEHKLLLRDFLTHCDLVKFARHTPASFEAEEAVALCRRFIRETEPSPALAGTGGAG